jgi:hypothetical protein
MANQSHRGGMKTPSAQSGSEKQHQGVHPGSTTQSVGSSQKKSGRDPHAHEPTLPKKGNAGDHSSP